MKKLFTLLLMPVVVSAHNVSNNIDIIPLEKMPFPEKLKSEMRMYNHDLKIKGFVDKENTYIRQLMKMRINKPLFTKPGDASSNELKKTAQEIATTFNFQSVLSHPIAYAGIGIESDKKWSGIKEFFDGESAGMCTLSVFYIGNIKDHIKLNQENLQYLVNDKPTRTSIEGNQNSGFMYSVRWYDKDYAREIECANYKLDNLIVAQIIEYARVVDKA